MKNSKLHSLHQVNSNIHKTRSVCNCRNCTTRHHSIVKLDDRQFISQKDKKMDIEQPTTSHGVIAKDDSPHLQNHKVKNIATKISQTDEYTYRTVTKAIAGIDLAKKAFVKARISYPKRRISNENLAAVKQEMTKSMFAPLVDHLSTLKLSLQAKQINFALVNHELREFDSMLFNKLMAQVYYRKPRRSKTTSVPINKILLQALEGTLWQHANQLKNAAFLNSTLLYLLACLDPEKADTVYKEILSQAAQ
jgi:hypothetical protein